MLVNFIYNSLAQEINLKDLFKNIPEDIIINKYDLSYRKEAKKGWAIMNKYAARKVPFLEITDGTEWNKLLYVSYGEVKDNITNKELLEIINNLNK